jgi:hypothetical protein
LPALVSPHVAPTGFGDPTESRTGLLSPPISVSGTGRGSEFGDRGGDGRMEGTPPTPPRPVAILSLTTYRTNFVVLLQSVVTIM